MPDFNVHADSVNVEQIMEQIRARIREKRGVDYTEDQVRELASVKLEKFLDPRGVRSDLLDQFKRAQLAQAPAAPPNYRFEEDTLFETHRGPVRVLRRLLQPILKLMFNPGPRLQALNIQSTLNTLDAQQETARRGLDQLYFEVLHNLVLETTRMSIEVKNLKMRVESLTSRLEFNERRARALESVVVYKPSEPAETVAASAQPAAQPERPRHERGRTPFSGGGSEKGGRPPLPQQEAAVEPAAAIGSESGTAGAPATPEGPGQRSRRRRRRRGRRGGGSVAATMGGAPSPAAAEAPRPVETGQPESGDAENTEETDFSSLIDSSTSSGFREETLGAVSEPAAAALPDPESDASPREPGDGVEPDRGPTLRESQGGPEPGRGTTGSGPSGDQ